MLMGYLESEKRLVSIDRSEAPTRIAGTSRKEKRSLAALEARRNYLEMRVQDCGPNERGYERKELSALEWALEIIQEYFDLINREDL